MKRLGAAILCLGILVTLYQNCGKAGFENSEILDQLSTATELDPKFSKLPFPYQVSVNQIAHMSCPITKANPGSSSPYFSWKIGAFDNTPDMPSNYLQIKPAGLQLRSEFITEWNKIAPTYAPTIQKDKLKEALMTLPSVANTQLQLSFRKTNTPKTDLMQMPAGGDSPYVNFMPLLTDDSITNLFKDLPIAPLNLFANATKYEDRFLETTLTVPSSLGSNEFALRANYDSSYMALGFVIAESTDGSKTELRSPSSDIQYAYGKGYRIHFGTSNPHQNTTLYPPSDSLASVEETDLDTGYATPNTGWDCSLRFKIVRAADRGNPVYRANHFGKINGQCPTAAVTSDYCASPIHPEFGIHPFYFPNGVCPPNRTLVRNTLHCEEKYSAACPSEPFAADLAHPNQINRYDGLHHPNYPERPAILHALRRFLPANQWDINVSRRCVVAKMEDNSCYANPPVVYDDYFFPANQADPNMGQYQGCGVTGQYQCAAYLTLCVRR